MGRGICLVFHSCPWFSVFFFFFFLTFLSPLYLVLQDLEGIMSGVDSLCLDVLEQIHMTRILFGGPPVTWEKDTIPENNNR